MYTASATQTKPYATNTSGAAGMDSCRAPGCTGTNSFCGFWASSWTLVESASRQTAPIAVITRLIIVVSRSLNVALRTYQGVGSGFRRSRPDPISIFRRDHGLLQRRARYL